MKRLLVTQLIFVFAFGVRVLAQEPPPREPFKTVHLVNVTSASDVAELQAMMEDLNGVVATAGYSETRYRLFRLPVSRRAPTTIFWNRSGREPRRTIGYTRVQSGSPP